MPPDELPAPPAAPPAQPTAAPPAGYVPPAAPLPAQPPAAPARRPADDEETPEDRARASNIRQRERAKANKELYGTDDPEEIERIKRQRSDRDAQFEKDQAELVALRKKDQDAERAKMSDVERLTADLAARDARIKDLEAELAKTKQEAVSERQSSLVKQAAVRHRIKAKPSIMRVVLSEFGAHYLELTSVEKKQWASPAAAERLLDKWMGRFAKDNPEMCDAPPAVPADPAAAAPKPAAPRPTVVRQPIGAPRRPAPPPPARTPTTSTRTADMDENGKTTRPGQPNSMNAAELAAFKRKQGLKAS